MGVFSEAMHPRGSGGKFAAGSGVLKTHEHKGGRRKEIYTPMTSESLFFMKAGRFRKRNSPRAGKVKVQFNKLVFDPDKREAVTVRRHVSKF